MDFLGLGIGLPQLVVILLVAMLVLGPERLPEVARQLARGIRTLRGYAADVQGQFEGELGTIREEIMGIQRDLTSVQGNLRSSLVELDTTFRSVQDEVHSSVTGPLASLPGALTDGTEPVGAASSAPPQYTPAVISPRAAAVPHNGATAALPSLLEAPDGRIPDYKPPA